MESDSIIASAISLVMTAVAEDSSSDDDVGTPPATPRKLPKSREFFDNIQRMDDQEFRSHFRLGRGIQKYFYSITYQ